MKIHRDKSGKHIGFCRHLIKCDIAYNFHNCHNFALWIHTVKVAVELIMSVVPRCLWKIHNLRHLENGCDLLHESGMGGFISRYGGVIYLQNGYNTGH